MIRNFIQFFGMFMHIWKKQKKLKKKKKRKRRKKMVMIPSNVLLSQLNVFFYHSLLCCVFDTHAFFWSLGGRLILLVFIFVCSFAWIVALIENNCPFLLLQYITYIRCCKQKCKITFFNSFLLHAHLSLVFMFFFFFFCIKINRHCVPCFNIIRYDENIFFSIDHFVLIFLF